MNKQKVLVAGASGYLGRYVTKEFAERGYAVRALVRTPEKLSMTGPNLEPAVAALVEDVVRGDAADRASLKDACRDVDIVFSCMGLTKPQDNVTSEQVDHLGNRALLEDALSHGVKKFIYISVFNAEKMMDVDVVKAHELFVNDLRSSGISYTVIRPTGFFSDMGMFLSSARSGHMFMLGDGDNRVNPIHGADLAKVCVDAAENSEKEICVGGPDTYTFNETMNMAFEAVGKSPWITHIPMWVGDAALFVTGIFNRSLAGVLAFAVSVSGLDNVAPATGSHHLKDFYRDLAAKEEKNGEL
ncbi:MAG: SDR family oxidoreductase [Chlorobium sp.]|uniref:SDR family oxidoreductase n=1 Tax=Chlorobium sp. TaxID=1095 RepID=UPI0025C10ED1|nr:SDR family oxidoreductase [Chlorobium sp.]MCF8217173.1 SDR family oxidoreductase [Chlorobium sp.]MCF8272020.1 SDR family oxidoreductase [Chlorobium sp.]MCF8288391.1 SDR family oxidoreductase [Chlorobium sp.]MCF8291991.1 SDR family oxidoreductase [Chlorobium sp.]MCF8386090.1 SDR family oxidoreductase [Chlorobium sp.]